jgi:3-oxoadipate enol-lactonase
MNIQQGFANVNGTRLYFETAGSGFPAVFLHGFTLDTRMWDDQFTPLADKLRVIRYDMRGFGQSALPTEEPYSQVDDLSALLDHLEVPSAALIGHSRGGAVAIEFSLTHPDKVQALALLDSVIGGFSWSQEAAARDGLVWEKAQEGGVPAAKESWLTHPLFVPAQRNAAVAKRLAVIINDYSGWHFVNSNPETYLDPPAAQRVAELSMPLLAIIGEEDLPDFQAITDLICAQAPQASKVTIPKAGHMANMEAAEEVTRHLVAFLEAHARSG